MKTVKAFAIISPKGRLMMKHIDDSVSGAWSGLIPLWANEDYIKELEQEGFKVVPVQITEVSGD